MRIDFLNGFEFFDNETEYTTDFEEHEVLLNFTENNGLVLIMVADDK